MKKLNGETLDILGVVYNHRKTSDGGDLYLTNYGLECENFLNIDNWYDETWFESKSEKLRGTSSVFRVPTKEIAGENIQLVVKNCRVGEDVPVDTHTLEQFVNAEFNSPWEEFALVFELRQQALSLKHINTQNPLAIYVPPEQLQLWQTGRSRTKINKINRRHPGIELDILRQYKLIYQWIDGLDLVQTFEFIGLKGDKLNEKLRPLMTQVLIDLEQQEFAVADMKAVHVIISQEEIIKIKSLSDINQAIEYIENLIYAGKYSVIDYELLLRTARHEERIKSIRRHSYLDVQRDRFVHAPLPSYLIETKILGVPYVHGRAESTGGLLWVVGRNAQLFDYFLPERWRKTPSKALSKKHEVFYTLTKDNIHIVWRTSRVGENLNEEDLVLNSSNHGFNSPFEEFSIAMQLEEAGIPCVYVRAIYMTGSTKLEPVIDRSRFEKHRFFTAIDGQPILRETRNYISIRGFYNGPDSWVAEQEGALFEPIDLVEAIRMGILSEEKARNIFNKILYKLDLAGFIGKYLVLNNVLIARRPDGLIALNPEGQPEARISNFETIYKS